MNALDVPADAAGKLAHRQRPLPLKRPHQFPSPFGEAPEERGRRSKFSASPW